MQFAHRVRSVWSWLPAFRAVAEAEHLPTAAHQLGIVPSSLSRTVRQIEEALGVPLFDRTAQTLTLNRSGQTLVAAVREAMRVVDDALGQVVGDDLSGDVAAVAPRDLVQTVLMPAGAVLNSMHPGLAMCALTAEQTPLADLLLRGHADAALTWTAPPPHADLVAVELASYPRSVYAQTSPASIDDARWVIVGTPKEAAADGWPHRDRHVVAWAPDQLAALELAARTNLLVVAHDPVVERAGFATRLHRLDLEPLAPQPIWLVHRRAVGHHPRTEALVHALRVAAAVS